MFAEDLTAFLSADAFSVPCTLPLGDVVQVIFDQPHADAFGVMESTNPSALGRSADLDTVSHGSEVLINDAAWLVVGLQPDGTGLTRLLLEPAA